MTPHPNDETCGPAAKDAPHLSELKAKLAVRRQHDREAYIDAKSAFVHAAVLASRRG